MLHCIHFLTLHFKKNNFYFHLTLYPLYIFILLLFILPACNSKDAGSLDQAQAAAVKDSVRILANAVARDVTQEGPKAWLSYFENSPNFFMASGGKLVFPNYDSAVTFVNWFASTGRKIQLTWNDLNIDPLKSDIAVLSAIWYEVITDTSGNRMPQEGYFTGLVEHTPAGWKFRNLHWSIADQQK